MGKYYTYQNNTLLMQFECPDGLEPKVDPAGNSIGYGVPPEHLKPKGMGALGYVQQRYLNYPPLEDLADALYWKAQGDLSKMDEYLNKVKEVKAQFPKS